MEPQEKEFIVLLDGRHEYTIKESTNKKGHRILRLFYSEAEFWRYDLRGTEILKMVDTGDDVRLSKVSRKMDYGQLAELRLLLSFAKATDANPVEREGGYQVYSRVENSISGDFIKI